MSAAPPPYAAAVLCGGHSRRMGTDKAHLPAPDGKTPLLLHQLRTLADLAPPPAARLVAARTDQALPPLPAAVERLDDDGATGPLGAVLGLLNHLNTPHLLVIPVDAPGLDSAILQALLERTAAAPGHAVVARSAGDIQPLVACYPREFGPVFAAAHAADRLSLRRLLTQPGVSHRVAWVDFPDDPRFANWNTPEERQRDNQG